MPSHRKPAECWRSAAASGPIAKLNSRSAEAPNTNTATNCARVRHCSSRSLRSAASKPLKPERSRPAPRPASRAPGRSRRAVPPRAASARSHSSAPAVDQVGRHERPWRPAGAARRSRRRGERSRAGRARRRARRAAPARPAAAARARATAACASRRRSSPRDRRRATRARRGRGARSTGVAAQEARGDPEVLARRERFVQERLVGEQRHLAPHRVARLADVVAERRAPRRDRAAAPWRARAGASTSRSRCGRRAS